MEHEDWRREVWALRDGELPADREAPVRDHVAACADCRSAWSAWDDVSRTIARLPEDVDSAALWSTLRPRAPVFSPWWRDLWFWSAAASLALWMVLFTEVGGRRIETIGGVDLVPSVTDLLRGGADAPASWLDGSWEGL